VTNRSNQLRSALVVSLDLGVVQERDDHQADRVGNVTERCGYASNDGRCDQIDAGSGEHDVAYLDRTVIASLKFGNDAYLLALSALLARGLSVDPRAIGTKGKPSLRNQKEVLSISIFIGRRRRLGSEIGSMPIAPIVPIGRHRPLF